MEETVPSAALDAAAESSATAAAAADRETAVGDGGEREDAGAADRSESSGDEDDEDEEQGEEDGPVDESTIKEIIRDFLRTDNEFQGIKDDLKEIRAARKTLIGKISEFMVKRSLVKIPVKPNDEEYLQLAIVKKVKRPSKSDMANALARLLAEDDGVLDRSAPEIVEQLVAPKSTQEVYDIKRKHRRARKGGGFGGGGGVRGGSKRGGDSSDSSEAPKLRDLMAGKRSSVSGSGAPSSSGGGAGGGETADQPPAKRRKQ